MTTALEQLSTKLASIEQATDRYRIPSLWIAPHSHAGVRKLTHPARFYHSIVERILTHPPHTHHTSISEHELFYLAPLRLLTAWDHDGRDNISYDLTVDGWRTTGSFLKTIALLPYLKWLGVTTLLLLPLSEHGRSHIKGTLGSLYAPRRHTTIEPTLTEPIVELDADTQFAAMIEACHRMGIRVIAEVALRVASLDCPLIAQHPEWFYWVRADAPEPLSPPHFSEDALSTIERAVANRRFDNLPEPDEDYRALFTEPPHHVWCTDDGTYLGQTADGSIVRVPNAFADYPPNDTQPLWTDITYFRLHTHPSYPYLAYNTVRYFPPVLEGWENRALWEYIANVIPSMLERFDLDGFLLDMGHALPYTLHKQIIERARAAKPNVLLIEESFDRHDHIAEQLGYDAVVGDSWHYAHAIPTFRRYAATVCRESCLRFLATPDTHNTPRIATRGFNVAAYAYALCSQLPEGIPLITCGSEFGEQSPINTGLDFQQEELSNYPPEKLGLFSGCVLSWDLPDIRMLHYIKSLHANDAR
jgi:glycosidase